LVKNSVYLSSQAKKLDYFETKRVEILCTWSIAKCASDLGSVQPKAKDC